MRLEITSMIQIEVGNNGPPQTDDKNKLYKYAQF